MPYVRVNLQTGEKGRQVNNPAEIGTQTLEFGLLTRYTSLVAIDKTPSRSASEGFGSESVPSLLPAGSGFSTGFSQTSTGWVIKLLLALLSISAVSAMLLYVPPRLPMASSPP